MSQRTKLIWQSSSLTSFRSLHSFSSYIPLPSYHKNTKHFSVPSSLLRFGNNEATSPLWSDCGKPCSCAVVPLSNRVDRFKAYLASSSGWSAVKSTTSLRLSLFKLCMSSFLCKFRQRIIQFLEADNRQIRHATVLANSLHAPSESITKQTVHTVQSVFRLLPHFPLRHR